mmetsp:Transcript_41893/g.132090  ORF Transcript_41893/g.132090 Transcript_41893/m.132090 type:complete len:416 (-) Transcript_41893:1649-2896(-)
MQKHILVLLLCFFIVRADALPNSTTTLEQKGLQEDQDAGEFFRTFLEPRRVERSVDLGRLLKIHIRIPGQLAWHLKSCTYLALWFLSGVAHDIGNKLAISTLRRPLLHTLTQSFIGTTISCLVWSTGVRRIPALSWRQVQLLVPLAIYHAVGLVFGNVAVMLGPLAFIYVLKQFEPIAASWIFLLMGRGKCLKCLQDKKPTMRMLASIVPALFGSLLSLYHMIASRADIRRYPMREVCNAQQFLAAAVSTCFSLLRSVMGQETLSMKGWSQKKTNLNGPNLIAVMQAMTGALLTPILLLSQIVHLLSWNLNSPSLVLLHKRVFTLHYLLPLLLSSIAYQLHYEAAFLSLRMLSPISYSLANQVKTLVYIASAARFFGPAMPVKSFLASTVTTASLILYSKELARSYESVRQTVSK